MKINLPNMLIVLRVVLIPVFLVSFSNASYAGRIIPMAVFLIAAITDYFDGLLARKWNTVSNFGKLMDPLADKMLVSAAMIALAYRQELAAWVVVIIICREFWVTSLRMLALEQGNTVIAASMWGKIKTVLQMIMLTVLIAGVPTGEFIIDFGRFGDIIAAALIYSSVVATIVSAVEYTWDYKDVFRS